MKFSNMHPAKPSIVSDTVVLNAPLSMTTNVNDRCIIVLVRKIEIQVDSAVDRLPNVIPALFMGMLDATLATLLTSCASARSMSCSEPEL